MSRGGGGVKTLSPTSPIRRRLPSLGRHQLFLAMVLFALIPVAGLGAVWSADEGALLYQLDAVVAGRGWTFSHPFAAVDQSGTWFPIHLASWAAGSGPEQWGPVGDCWSTADRCRYVVLAKHAGYLHLSAGLYRVGGYGALIAASVASTVAAAAATARLAAMVDRAAAVPALWIAGLASPLFMASYVAWGHTLAAALIGWAAVLLLGSDRRAARRGAGLTLLFLACLVRTEAPLAGLAIGFGLIVVSFAESWAILRSGRPSPTAIGIEPGAGASGRDGDRDGLHEPPSVPSLISACRDQRLTGAAAVATAVAGVIVDRLTDVPTEGPVEPIAIGEAFGFLAGRVEAFTITWLQPAYGSDPRDLLILAAAALTLVAGVLARRGPTASTGATAAMAAAVLALGARFVVAPGALVPGLVVAFPVLFAGLLLLDRKTIVADRAMVLLAPFCLYCGAVLATQYRHGGGGEWGGRYFAVGLPLGTAAATVGLVRAGALFARPTRRSLGGLVVVSMVLLSTMGLLGLRAVRHQTANLAIDIDRALDPLERAGDEPVVVTTVHGLGRWMWRDVDRGRWLRVPEGELAAAGSRLRSLGVDALVLVSADPARETELLGRSYRPDTEADGRSADLSAGAGIVVLTMERKP